MNADETVAPDKEQSNLVLRKLEDALRDKQSSTKLEQETGMTREQMEQFVRKFKKAPKAEPGPGREIEVKPGAERKLNPKRTLPDLNPNVRASTTTIRNRGTVVQDQVRGNVEETRFVVPEELRAGFEAYKSTLSRSKPRNPGRPAQGAGGH